MWRGKLRPLSALLAVLVLLGALSPGALAAPPEDLIPAEQQELRYERWYQRMEDIVELFRQWSAYMGCYDGKAYCTSTGKAFTRSEGDECFIGIVTPRMKKAGLINYTVTGGWSCNGLARFALATLYGDSSFWRQQMTENVYTTSLFSRVEDVRSFMAASGARIGDMVTILGYADLDGNGTRDEYFHYMIYIRETGEGLWVLDGNFDHDNSVQIHLIPWTFLMSREWIYLYHVSDNKYYAIDRAAAAEEPESLGCRDDWRFLAK